MYITYITRQWIEDKSPARLIGPHDRPTRQIPHQLPKPAFTPTWLVRISDMTMVPGTSVTGGYCALSYSWNQSGDMIDVNEEAAKTERVDEGKHRIIFPCKKVRKKPRGRKRIGRKVKFVMFEGIIQQVCKNFGIEYIWYDQMCIPQDDPKAKQQEILQMYQIYSNAYCTVVLLPEYRTSVFGFPGKRSFRSGVLLKPTEWLQRLWTFEEVLLSQRLLFVGRDIHSWWYTQRKMRFRTPLDRLCQRSIHTNASWWNACNTLAEAHQPTTRKDHDRVYALASLFPDIISKIPVNYTQSLSDLMIRFYDLLAKKDLSILCFGKQLREEHHMQQYNLPSWTGAAGQHRSGYTFEPHNNAVVDMDGKLLHVTCRSITSIKPTAATGEDPSTWVFDDIPPRPDDPSRSRNSWNLSIKVHLPGNNDKLTAVIDIGSLLSQYNTRRRSFMCPSNLVLLSLFMPFKKENIFWWDDHRELSNEIPQFHFDLTENDDNYHTTGVEYAILSGIRFSYERSGHERFPVIKREGDHYKAIGTCQIRNSEYFFNVYSPSREKTFIVQ